MRLLFSKSEQIEEEEETYETKGSGVFNSQIIISDKNRWEWLQLLKEELVERNRISLSITEGFKTNLQDDQA